MGCEGREGGGDTASDVEAAGACDVSAAGLLPARRLRRADGISVERRVPKRRKMHVDERAGVERDVTSMGLDVRQLDA